MAHVEGRSTRSKTRHMIPLRTFMSIEVGLSRLIIEVGLSRLIQKDSGLPQGLWALPGHA
jgi:hypothetical protein